ncbi:unnamed protein product [Durusdinium trenchii]|uniref:Uncharacterized protein n=1 Tax=Durusdinium trenchii TaxID=1381693 RepID=A0ABP0J8Z6_9DINO
MPISTHKCRGYPLSPAWPDDIVLFLIILRPPCHGEITCLCQVMCDLFCIDDAVRSGTTAVLSSLQDSHAALMTNLQALLDYQTQYLLWAIGTAVNPHPVALESEEVLAVPVLLKEIEEFPEKEMRPGLVLGREVLDWHRKTGEELTDRIMAMSINASMENWPHRVKSMKGMLHHYRKSLTDRLQPEKRRDNDLPSVPSTQKMVKEKLQYLSDQASEHREVAEVVQSLHMQHVKSPVPLLEDQARTSILESFLHTHEKHNTFSMLHLKALDQTDYAVNLAHNFSECAGVDTALLREAWQRAFHADERSSEALLEAWAATLTTSERLQVAVKDEGFLDRLPHLIVLDTEDQRLDPFDGMSEPTPSSLTRAPCGNRSALVQEVYGQAVAMVVSSLRPLAMQLNTFKVLATYQEQQLKHRQLEYVPMTDSASVISELQMLLQEVSIPTSAQGRALAARAVKHLAQPTCPSLGAFHQTDLALLSAVTVETILLL